MAPADTTRSGQISPRVEGWPIPVTDSKPSMNFQGYIDRVEFHFERMGVTERPSKQEYIDAWNNQMPARKLAQTFSRRHQRTSRKKGD